MFLFILPLELHLAPRAADASQMLPRCPQKHPICLVSRCVQMSLGCFTVIFLVDFCYVFAIFLFCQMSRCADVFRWLPFACRCLRCLRDAHRVYLRSSLLGSRPGAVYVYSNVSLYIYTYTCIRMFTYIHVHIYIYISYLYT